MKRMIFCCLFLAHVNAFAGDLYLVCETDDGEQLVSSAVNNNEARVEFQDFGGDFEVILKMKKNINLFIVKNTLTGQATTHFVKKGPESISASENFSCRVSD